MKVVRSRRGAYVWTLKHAENRRRKGALVMVRWLLKGLVRMYLCDSRNNLHYNKTGKGWKVKQGAFDEKKYGGKSSNMLHGSRYKGWTRKQGKGLK